MASALIRRRKATRGIWDLLKSGSRSAAVPAAVVGASRPHSRGQDTLETAGETPALQVQGSLTTASARPFSVIFSPVSLVEPGGSKPVVWSTYSSWPPAALGTVISNGRSRLLISRIRRFPSGLTTAKE